MNRIFLTFFAFTFTVLNTSCNSESRKYNDIWNVQRIIDGDTFVIYDGSKKGVKVRLIGVDAPETRRTGKKEIGYYGKEATDFLSVLISGESVKLQYDVSKYDRYGRTLAYVYLMDGTFVNAELVKQGYAMVMTVPPNVKYAETFVNLQREARENKRGLWNENNNK